MVVMMIVVSTMLKLKVFEFQNLFVMVQWKIPSNVFLIRKVNKSFCSKK